MLPKRISILLVLISTIIVQASNTQLAAREDISVMVTVPNLADFGIQVEEISPPQPLMLDTAVFQSQPNYPTKLTANNDPFPLGPFAPAGHFEMLLFGDSVNLVVGPSDILIGYNEYGILSTNAGISWRLIEDDWPLTTIKHANMPPTANEPIFVVNGHGNLLRSLNNGKSWEHVAQNVYHVQQSVYSPTYQQDRLIFAVEFSGNNRLARSVDRGQNWTTNNIPYLVQIALAPDFNQSQLMLGSRWNAVYRSTDGGYNWQPANEGLNLAQGNVIRDILFSPGHTASSVAYAVTDFGVYKSQTGGQNWQPFLPFLIKKFTLHPNYPHVPTFFMIAAVTVNGEQFDVLFRSDNDGQTYQALAANVSDFGLSSQYATNSNLYAMIPTGLIYSNNNGATWYIMSYSIGKSYPKQLLASPNMAADSTLYFVTTRYQGDTIQQEVWHTNTLGFNWQKLPVPRENSHEIYFAISPNFATDQTLMLLTFAYQQWNELYRSTDGGNSWHLLNAQLPFADATALKISPNYAQDQTIFVASYFDHGLFRSQNNGQTWQNIFPDKFLRDFAIAPDYPSDNRLFVSIQNQGIARSDNGGGTWLPATYPSFYNNLQIALSPNFQSDNTLLAMNGESSGGGVWRSTDAGNSWQEASTNQMANFHHTLSISEQFDKDQTAVVGIETRGIFMTEDAGENWFHLNGIKRLQGSTTIPQNTSAVAYWQGRPTPILVDRTGYYFYLWPTSTSAAFSCQNLLLESDIPQSATIAVSAKSVGHVGWQLHNHDIPWLSVAQMSGMTPAYPQVQIDTANLTEPAQATLTLDIYLSYRQKQTHTFPVFVPCFAQNLPLISRTR
jgi:photosystem II stability/assembly factor-like uncharacterized protein